MLQVSHSNLPASIVRLSVQVAGIADQHCERYNSARYGCRDVVSCYLHGVAAGICSDDSKE